MNENDHMIRILDSMMQRLRMMSRERDMPVNDLIDRALGDYLSFHETGINLFDIINSIENHLTSAEHFVTDVDLYNHAISVKSPIRYVYRPELKYQISIAQNDRVSIGKMSVALRSNDMNTLRSFSAFINLWVSLEKKYIRSRERIEYISDAGYFERKVYLPANDRQISGQEIGEAISDYISAFDELLKHYFTRSEGSVQEIERMYCGLVQDGKLRI